MSRHEDVPAELVPVDPAEEPDATRRRAGAPAGPPEPPSVPPAPLPLRPASEELGRRAGGE